MQTWNVKCEIASKSQFELIWCILDHRTEMYDCKMILRIYFRADPNPNRTSLWRRLQDQLQVQFAKKMISITIVSVKFSNEMKISSFTGVVFLVFVIRKI